MAVRGEVSVSDYLENVIADRDILEFIPRIRIAVDDILEKMGPSFRHAARVTVTTTDGRVFMHDVHHRRGSPENPVSRNEVERKFMSNVALLLSGDSADRLMRQTADLDNLPNVSEMVGILGSAGPSL